MQVQCRLMKERWSYDALILITEVGDRVGIGFSLTLTRPPIITHNRVNISFVAKLLNGEPQPMFAFIRTLREEKGEEKNTFPTLHGIQYTKIVLQLHLLYNYNAKEKESRN